MMKNIAMPIDVLRRGDPEEMKQYGFQKMTLEEINERVLEDAVVQQDELENGYKRRRQMEYPPIGDQLDAIWKALNEITENADATQMLERIKEIKAKYVRGE